MLIGLLITVLIVLAIAWLVALIVQQLPGMPPFAASIIWVLALLFILLIILNRFGGLLRCC